MILQENEEQGLIALAEKLESLHARWIPHAGQIPIGMDIIYNNVKKVFVCAGRSFGKSQLASYLCVRNAIENPGSTNFIFCPFITQGREIYWTPRLIHNLLDESEIESINATEMRIILTNGSQIKICGSDNVDSYRGVKPAPNSIIVFEEFKDIKQEFIDAFMPNLSVNNPVLLIIGTPPENENHFTQFMHYAQNNPHWRFFWSPTETNPYVSKEYLEQQREFLEAQGMKDVWEREYMARFTLGGHRSIFPMIVPMELKPFDSAWPKDSNKWDLYVGFDPASSSTFAVIFMLFNPYKKKVIAVDEIYESRPEFMSARKIHAATNEKIKAFKTMGIKTIHMVYDSAARWFRQEIYDIDQSPEWNLVACDKSNGLQGEISAWRGVAAHGHIEFTDKVPKTKWELDNFIKDNKGRIPDKDDHLIQSGAYILKHMGFDFTESLEPRIIQKEEQRFYTFEDDYKTNEYEEI